MSKHLEKYFLIFLAILTVISISYTFYKTVIKQDFEVVNTDETPAADEELDW